MDSAYSMRKIKHYKQYDSNDCGIVSLMILADYYGIKIPYNHIRDNINVKKDVGINFLDMKKFLINNGIKARGIKAKESTLLSEIQLPVIVQTIDKDRYHFSVLYKVTKNKVYLSDPGVGKNVMSIEMFNELWTQYFLEIESIDRERTLEFKEGTNLILESVLKHKKHIAVIGGIGLIISILTILVSFQLQASNELFQIDKPFLIFNVIMITIIIAKEFLQEQSSNGSAIVAAEIEKDLKDRLLDKLNRTEYSEMITYEDGDINVRQFDIENISNGVSNMGSSLIVNIIILVTFLLLIATLDIGFSVILGIVSIIYIIGSYLASKKMKDFYKRLISSKEKFENQLFSYLSGILTIHTTNSKKRFTDKLNEGALSQICARLEMSKFLNVFKKYTTIVSEIVRIGIILYMFNLVMEGSMNFLTLMSIVFLLNYFMSSLNSIVNLMSTYSQMKESEIGLNRFYGQADGTKNANYQLDKEQTLDIKVSNLTLFYDKHKPLVETINTNIKQGDKILIRGKSGCGKTTFAMSIAGVHKGYEGQILFNEIDIKDISNNALYKRIAIVDANDYLFKGTIMENLTMHNTVSMNKVITVLKQVNIFDEVMHMENRLETVIYDGGLNLSSGQRKRLCIARALLRDTDIMILDEPTANVDVKTRKVILSSLLSSNKTVIIISHEVDIIDTFDKVYEIESKKFVKAANNDA